jgi:hypothetical protein
LGRGELDERALLGLRGVIKLSYNHWYGRTQANLEAFVPEQRWAALGPHADRKPGSPAQSSLACAIEAAR